MPGFQCNATGLPIAAGRALFISVDEEHPTYNEEPYSLSKWICEDSHSFARRYENMHFKYAFHGLCRNVQQRYKRGYSQTEGVQKFCGITRYDAAAALPALLTADCKGHEVFYITAPDTIVDTPSLELKQKFFPDIPVRGDLSGNKSFFNSSKAERLLGWKHDL